MIFEEYDVQYQEISIYREASNQIQPWKDLDGMQNKHLGKFCVFAGGLPIFKDGQCIGAIGVSGGTIDEDESIAKRL
ncbi:GlcG/HbpS family heme-binding protein [Streptococcus macacae]|uniref:PF03928 domain protein n=1 Tax=Streptococcus macacae NCTC 11558 TaxID=764298 RepID=G5JU05_9STRE|nr:heme-binding protein [Streptococcus macacae]EHJ52354.1 hypothetical protein STRMA_0545 [Streptococcus macacae NCTC 11558]